MALDDRKQALRTLMPRNDVRLLYCDHVELAGEEFFQLACAHDLEGIVAKRRFDPYLLNGTLSWYKVRNTRYSQWVGREELFERERGEELQWQGWDGCALTCDSISESEFTCAF